MLCLQLAFTFNAGRSWNSDSDLIMNAFPKNQHLQGIDFLFRALKNIKVEAGFTQSFQGSEFDLNNFIIIWKFVHLLAGN